MNVEKWKSVVIAIPTYKKLKKRAQKNHRTISGEFTYIMEQVEKKNDRPAEQAS
jgi:macrodomain Ter protein organizer (MatP/YcbG family)